MPKPAGYRLGVDADVLADEPAALIQAMGEGPYWIFFAALRAAGREVIIDADELQWGCVPRS